MREHFRTVHEVGKRRKMMEAHGGGGVDLKYALSDEEKLVVIRHMLEQAQKGG